MYLKNDLVALRALEPEDVDLLYDWENDPEIWTVSNTYAPFSRMVLEQYIADTMGKDVFELGQLRLVMEEEASGYAIGLVDLFDLSVRDSRASIGISVNEPEYRQRGFAKAALELLKHYAFDILCLHSLHARADVDNTASRRLFASCGFRESGILRDWHRTPDGWKDQVEMQIINKR